MMKARRLEVIFSLILVGTFLLMVSGVFAAWESKGPTGTSVQSIFCSKTPGNVFAGTNGGVYATSSANYGSEWIYKGLRNKWVSSIIITGNSCPPVTLLAAGERDIFASTDGGANWTLAIPMGDKIMSMAIRTSSCTGYAGTGGGVFNTDGKSGLLTDKINALAVDSSGNVYAGTEEHGIYKTTDNGTSWTPMDSTGLTPYTMIMALKIDGSDNIFAATIGGGVFMYPSSGGGWVRKVNGLPIFDGTANFYVVMSIMKNNGVLFASVLTDAPMTGAVYKSTDNGDNWSVFGDIAGASPKTICSASPSSTPDNNNIFVGTNRGVYRIRTDNTDPLNPEITTEDQTGLISAVPFRNTFIASGSDIFAGTDEMGVYKSNDNGGTWARAWTGANRPPQAVNALIKDGSGNMYASAGDIPGVYKSVNAGQDWTLASTGLPTVDLFGYTMFVEGTALGVDAAGNIYAGLDDGRIYKSIDQAGSWTATTDLGTTNTISSLSGGGPRDLTTNTLYVGTQGNGIFKTTDGGDTWTGSSTGLPDNSRIFERSFYMDMTTGDLYAGIEGNGLYRTSDTGNNWNKVTVLLPGEDPSHCSNNEVHAATIDQSGNLYAMICSGGVYVSGDMGTTWIDISGGLPPLDSLEGAQGTGVYADANNNILAATGSSGMYKYAKEYAKIAGVVTTYATALEAYNAASQAGDIVQLLALNFSENLVLENPVSPLTLKGGLSTGFGPTFGSSKIRGSLTIRQGTVITENIVII